jgi:hypothetical protein
MGENFFFWCLISRMALPLPDGPLESTHLYLPDVATFREVGEALDICLWTLTEDRFHIFYRILPGQYQLWSYGLPSLARSCEMELSVFTHPVAGFIVELRRIQGDARLCHELFNVLRASLLHQPLPPATLYPVEEHKCSQQEQEDVDQALVNMLYSQYIDVQLEALMALVDYLYANRIPLKPRMVDRLCQLCDTEETEILRLSLTALWHLFRDRYGLLPQASAHVPLLNRVLSDPPFHMEIRRVRDFLLLELAAAEARAVADPPSSPEPPVSRSVALDPDSPS